MTFQYILYAIIFVVVLLFVEGLYYLTVGSRTGTKAINRRMKMLAAGGGSREVMETLRRNREHTTGRYGALTVIANLDALVAQAGMTVSTERVIGIMAALTVVITLGIIAGVSIVPAYVAPFIAAIPGIGLPILYFKRKRKRKIKRLAAQLPDALDLIVRSLRAGHPITTSLTMVAQEMPDPIGTEFGILVDEMTYGLDFREALENMRQRVPAPDLHYLVVTINIQHGTGGNLAEVLHNLSTVIRSRFQMFAKIRALAAEGRISATILSALPVFVMAAVWVTTPGYYHKVMHDPLLPIIAGIALFLEISAVAVMWKMVNFKV